MRTRLQERVAYQDSLRWQMQADYYQQRGTDAFLSWEVPFQITSNRLAAEQNARVVLAAIQSQNLPANQPIRILELAGGLGLFALHFLAVFAELCEQAGLEYAQRLEYWLTDVSVKTLETLRQHPDFDARIQEGRLFLYQLDALNPEFITDLTGQRQILRVSGFSAIIANYFHCTLPVAILLAQAGEFVELETELFGWLVGSPTQSATDLQRAQQLKLIGEQLLQMDTQDLPLELAKSLTQACHIVAKGLERPDLAQNWAASWDLQACLIRWILEQLPIANGMIKGMTVEQLVKMVQARIVAPLFGLSGFRQDQLEDVHATRTVQLASYCPDPDAQAVILELTASFETATLTYPLGSLRSLQALLPCLLPQGVLLISDKGESDSSGNEGFHKDPPSLHGGSLAHLVNFPFLAQWLARKVGAICWTQDPTTPIQTLLAINGPELPSLLAGVFEQNFVTANRNMDYQLLLEAGRMFCKQRDFETAIRFFLRALRINPQDPTLLMALVDAYRGLRLPLQALNYLDQIQADVFLNPLLANVRSAIQNEIVSR